MVSLWDDSWAFGCILSGAQMSTELLITVINAIVTLIVAYMNYRNRKDIDGVAEVVGTERAKARIAKN